MELDSAEAWGSLIPLANTQPLPTYTLTQSEILVGRNAECVICINDKRLSGKHCTLSKTGDKITLKDLSTNGTFLGDKKIGKNNEVELVHSSEIWLLTASKVPTLETIGFRLEVVAAKKEEQKRKEEEEKAKAEKEKEREKEEEEARKKREAEAEKKKEQDKAASSFAQSIKDQITCPFCFEIMSIPVAIQPCNHRFCGGCLTDLVNSKKDTCIQCRKEITTAVRDAAFTSIIDDYLKSHPEEKRDPKEEEDLKAKNIFGFDPINVHEKIHGKTAVVVEKKKAEPPASTSRRGRGRKLVRASSDLSASDDDTKDKCRECVVARDGFQCSATQVHVGCHTCGKLIAQRDDPDLNQCCAICTTYYCNLYYPPCKVGTKLVRLEDRREGCKIDAELLRGNKFEFEIIRNHLLEKKLNSKNLFDHMLEVVAKGKFAYLMDRKIMKVPPLVPKEVKLQKGSAICDLCWHDLWFQMVFQYRLEIAGQLPSAVRDRPVCYWGINCRTMDHNVDHAKRYSHCIYQTRFS